MGEHSSAKLTGYLTEWAALEDKCANQKFNASDTSPLPHNRLWPELARWFGAPGSEIPELDESKITTIEPGDGPIPLGYGPGRKTRLAWTFTNHWARDAVNRKAWEEIMKQHNLSFNPFDNIEDVFTFGDAASIGLVLQLSINKARYFGWTGHVDTLESVHQVYGELAQLGAS